ncbi:MAG TPA: hypothetical protein VKM69_12640, partial [Natronoarchaeum rubrum]|nr:hypothetical protein [Natronoarchaeum rubrum]
AVVVSMVLGPLTVLSFLVDPAGFLARNGALSICYLTAASLGTVLHVAFAVRVVAAVNRRVRSAGRDAGPAPGVRPGE